ncbi:hypothetical protein [Xanthomonas fragariae]|uniref:hypothetical protein n=1 Tax=Xanthomonas fragariae TaxID=48664 RepID=UPI001ABDEFAD|nr:hypothetical protein [Xanthomonas fragariae]UKR51881.1 hypothetical protein K4A87_14315 [Xanthomonas fragariae]
MFQIVRVPSGAADLPEQMGTKAKFWFDENRRLFKEGRPGTGENWAEVIAAELAALLGLPHAKYSLAEYEERRGVVSESFVPAGARLILGNELIGFAAREIPSRRIRREAHTIGRLGRLLNRPSVALPSGWVSPKPTFNAADVMSGYLLLDALIANQDRHEENWGFINSRGAIYLAPTFDHASSLGRNETDQRRMQKLTANHPDHGVYGYARRAKVPIYYGSGQLHSSEAFFALSRVCPDKGRHWLNRLREIDPNSFAALLGRIPVGWITDPARRFADELLRVNRNRLLDQ